MTARTMIPRATFALICITACASVPKADNNLVASARSFTPSPGRARIYVARVKSLIGAALTQTVVVDGRIIGATGPGTFLMTEVDPGPHVVSAAAQGNAQAQQIDAEAGQCYFIKMSLNTIALTVSVKIERVTETEGRDLVRRYRMAAPTQGQ